jgi:hypothetical protein
LSSAFIFSRQGNGAAGAGRGKGWVMNNKTDPTSGSGAFRYLAGAGAIVHKDGRSWRPPQILRDVYALLDLCRGAPVSASHLTRAIYYLDGAFADVGKSILALRALCGPEIVEEVYPPDKLAALSEQWYVLRWKT